MFSAFQLLDDEIISGRKWLVGNRLTQAGVTTAITWSFTNRALAGFIENDRFFARSQFAERIENRRER